ncbi:hypothetical protein DL767_005463 [Monosporascus sp. MG133]|nr:hypothetical protein DL767_005463 [Monosporascus sp. MG133]
MIYAVAHEFNNRHRAANPSSRKRKAETSLEEDIGAYKQNLDHIKTDGMMLDKDCRQVRYLINKLLDNSIMKKGEFCDAIGNSYGALNSILKMIGTVDGCTSEVYQNLHGISKLPPLKIQQPLPLRGRAVAPPPSASSFSHIHLPGEEIDDVMIYDTCDEIGGKINEHLKTSGVTQAQFCRDLYAQLRMPKTSGTQPKLLADFRAKKAPPPVTPSPSSMPRTSTSGEADW